jgi:hypothetical protein
MSASKPAPAAHRPGMTTTVPGKKPRKPRALPMTVCQVCSGGKAPKGGGMVVCLTCSATPTQRADAA